jgi:uncharacterized protein (TIGR03067 family)
MYCRAILGSVKPVSPTLIMKRLSALFLAAGAWSVFAADLPQATQGQDRTLLDSGFTSIFNGRDLTGWEGNPKLWSVKEGAITGQTTAENPAKGNTFLIWTNGTVGDFELRCSFRLVPGDSQGFANSGIQYRSKVINPANWVVGGYQADMESGPNFTGILYEEAMNRGIMALRGEKVVWDKDCQKQVVGSVGKAEEIEASLKKGGWNEYVIIAKGNHLQQFVNGHQTVDVTDDCESRRAMSGVLALQLHAGSPMMAQFKNLRLKPLSADKAGADELKPLQGTWRIVSTETEGSAITPEDMARIVLTISNNTYNVDNNGRIDEGSFTVDPSKAPKQMEIQTGAGRTMPAIYEMDGDNLKVCYPRRGGQRPESFKGGATSLLIVYKRAKD